MRELKWLAHHMGVHHRHVSGHLRRARCAADGQARVLSERRRNRWLKFAAPAAALGPSASDIPASTRAASALEEKCEVADEMLELPIGLQATDRFIEAMRIMAGVKVPDVITDERGRLLDMIADMHQYVHGKRVALFGDPGPAGFAHRIPGLPGYEAGVHRHRHSLDARSKSASRAVLGDSVPEAKIRKGARSGHVPAAPVDQAGAGGSADRQYLRQIHRARREYSVRSAWLPDPRSRRALLFPDGRLRGAMRLLEKILNAFMDRQDREALEEKFELMM